MSLVCHCLASCFYVDLASCYYVELKVEGFAEIPSGSISLKTFLSSASPFNGTK